MTPDGPIVFYETLQTLCPRIYSIEDDHGAAAALLLSELVRQAEKRGIETIVCPCPLAPDDGPEHVLFPSIGVGFTTSNAFHKVDFPVYRRLHATRFENAEQLRAKRQVVAFNRRAAVELLAQAQTLAAEAKQVHDRMEVFSAAAMNWELANRMGDALIERLVAVARG